jgi:hypothetical protein
MQRPGSQRAIDRPSVYPARTQLLSADDTLLLGGEGANYPRLASVSGANPG